MIKTPTLIVLNITLHPTSDSVHVYGRLYKIYNSDITVDNAHEYSLTGNDYDDVEKIIDSAYAKRLCAKEDFIYPGLAPNDDYVSGDSTTRFETTKELVDKALLTHHDMFSGIPFISLYHGSKYKFPTGQSTIIIKK